MLVNYLLVNMIIQKKTTTPIKSFSLGETLLIFNTQSVRVNEVHLRFVARSEIKSSLRL